MASPDQTSWVDPPAYSTSSLVSHHRPAAEPTTHSYYLKDRRGHPWCTLRVQASPTNGYEFEGGPSKYSTIPRIIETQAIKGFVVLDLRDEMSIKEITVSFVGELVTDLDLHFTFISISQELWSLPNDASQHKANNKGKLLGSHTWPFVLNLPEAVQLADEQGDLKWFRPPANMRYTITAKIKHGLFIRSESTLSTHIAFVPIIEPSPPSPQRQLAYETLSPLPPPHADPDGWHTLPPVTFRGSLSANPDKQVKVTYTLSIALPLSYTRGTTIPLHLSVQSSSEEALTLLSSTSAPLVRLRRTTRMAYNIFGGSMPLSRTCQLSQLKGLPSQSEIVRPRPAPTSAGSRLLHELKPLPLNPAIKPPEPSMQRDCLNIATWWETSSVELIGEGDQEENVVPNGAGTSLSATHTLLDDARLRSAGARLQLRNLQAQTQVQEPRPSLRPVTKTWTKTLQGEIHLPSTMRASAQLGMYKFFYDVAMFTPRVNNFTCDLPPNAKKRNIDDSWQAVEVEIATVYAPGPKPIAYTPPTYAEHWNEPQSIRSPFRIP